MTKDVLLLPDVTPPGNRMRWPGEELARCKRTVENVQFVAADVRRLKLQGLNARKKTAQSKQCNASAALGKRTLDFWNGNLAGQNPSKDNLNVILIDRVLL
jgi:hypothetical protein